MILGGEIGSERLVGGSERVGMMGGGEGRVGGRLMGDNRQPDEGVVVREVFMQNAKKSRCESVVVMIFVLQKKKLQVQRFRTAGR